VMARGIRAFPVLIFSQSDFLNRNKCQTEKTTMLLVILTSQNRIIEKNVNLGNSVWRTSYIYSKDRVGARSRPFPGKCLPVFVVQIVGACVLFKNIPGAHGVVEQNCVTALCDRNIGDRDLDVEGEFILGPDCQATDSLGDLGEGIYAADGPTQTMSAICYGYRSVDPYILLRNLQ
jgi:hypothetical protein